MMSQFDGRSEYQIRKRTMSLYEIGDSSGMVSLEAVCKGQMSPVFTGEVDLHDIIRYILRGGWPENRSATLEEAGVFPKAYLDALLNDAYRIDGINHDMEKMRSLLRSFAGNESTMATKHKLLLDIQKYENGSVDASSATTYFRIFNHLCLRDDQPAFSADTPEPFRLKKAVKRHFCDPSLACALLDATPESLLEDRKTLGLLFEALCEHDMKIYAEAFGCTLYHYRDYVGQEINAVIEPEKGKWCAFEIRLGTEQIDKAARSLLTVRENLEKFNGVGPAVLCVICGLSDSAYQRPDGVYVVPITALKN